MTKKTLGKLRAQTLKLKELTPPSDTSKGTKAFVRKHVYVVHPDANENGDEVFKASNVKKAKRFPDHGYEPGQDHDVYEDFDRAEYHKTQSEIHNNYADAVEKKDPGKAIAYRELARKHLRQAKRHARFHDSVTMKKGRTRGDSLLDDHRSSRRAEGGRIKARMRHEETGTYWNQKEETNLDEIMVPSMPALHSALSRSSRTARNPSAKRPAPKDNGYWKGTLELTPDMQDPAQKAEMEKHPLTRRINSMAKPEYRTLAAKRAVKEDWDSTEDRNNEHHYLHTHISDHIENISRTLHNHVNLMDKMNDKRHESSYHTLGKLHDALEDLSNRVTQIHGNAKKSMGMHTEDPPKVLYAPHMPVGDTAGNPVASISAAGKYSEGFEHIEALSESDQALLVDTYNSLTEENQDKFLEMAETEEGVDTLLDFAITGKAE